MTPTSAPTEKMRLLFAQHFQHLLAEESRLNVLGLHLGRLESELSAEAAQAQAEDDAVQEQGGEDDAAELRALNLKGAVAQQQEFTYQTRAHLKAVQGQLDTLGCCFLSDGGISGLSLPELTDPRAALRRAVNELDVLGGDVGASAEQSLDDVRDDVVQALRWLRVPPQVSLSTGREVDEEQRSLSYQILLLLGRITTRLDAVRDSPELSAALTQQLEALYAELLMTACRVQRDEVLTGWNASYPHGYTGNIVQILFTAERPLTLDSLRLTLARSGQHLPRQDATFGLRELTRQRGGFLLPPPYAQ